jgi:hypothetical protein
MPGSSIGRWPRPVPALTEEVPATSVAETHGPLEKKSASNPASSPLARPVRLPEYVNFRQSMNKHSPIAVSPTIGGRLQFCKFKPYLRNDCQASSAAMIEKGD